MTNEEIADRLLRVVFLEQPQAAEALKADMLDVIDRHRPDRAVLMATLSALVVATVRNQFHAFREGIDARGVAIALIDKGFQLRDR